MGFKLHFEKSLKHLDLWKYILEAKTMDFEKATFLSFLKSCQTRF